MSKSIIPAKDQLAALLEQPAKPQIGRSPKPFRANELALAIQKEPLTIAERESRVEKMRRHDLIVPVDDYYACAEFGAEPVDEAAAFDLIEQLNWS